MGWRLNGTYDPGLVALSIAVAVMASYVALDLASRVTASAGRSARYWLGGGALSMGMGIWSMHFIGMLAFRLPMPVSYNAAITALSLLIAMLVSGFALYVVSRAQLGLRNLVVGGVLMGIGIASMHYTGMAGMLMSQPIRYDPLLFTLSIVVAMTASWAALWIAFQLRGETLLSGFWRKAGSALVMGAAICGMHYTGMAAAIFPPHGMPVAGDPGLPNDWLAATIAAFTFVLLTTTLLVSLSDARRAHALGEHLQHSAAMAQINAALEAEVAERKQAERRLVQLAQFDPLTGLPNRRQFYDSLRNAIALAKTRDWQVPILFLDLDRFKNINDTLGHVVGDELLRQVGQRLLESVRLRDSVGRLGGDEFGIILTTPHNPHFAAEIAGKIIQALRRPFDLDGREVTVTTSVGITLYPVDSADIDTLIRYADAAMYESKAAGRDTYRFYTAEMNVRALEKLELENALRKALERNEFVLHYQPKIHIGTGRCTGVEALLRWNRPGAGLVFPDEFIPALEEIGLIAQVGEWVIDEACRQLAEWKEAGNGPPSVAVNVSARQVMRKPFVADEHRPPGPHPGAVAESMELESAAAAAILRHRLAPGELELELTESTLMSNAESNVRLLQRLKAQGLCISIDDFGTGYSSLAYLKRFPIDAIKIDRGFIRDVTSDPDDAAVVIAIIDVAHSLKLKVIAEGVETAEQLAFLGAHGCDEAQGYLFARPAAAGALAPFFSERS